MAHCRYRNGIRGHMKLVMEEILRAYMAVEENFQTHQYDKCVMELREKSPNDMAKVCQTLFSHQQVQSPRDHLQKPP